MAPGLDWSEHSQSKESDEKRASVRSSRCSGEGRTMGSRRIFAPQFKLQVLDSYRKDADCRGNQRATARKYGIHRRQIQKWLQVEASLRTAVEVTPAADPELTALNLCADAARQRDDSTGESRQATCQQNSVPCSEKNRPTRVTLFPRIKVELSEPQTEQKGVRVSLFPSVRVEVSKPQETVRVKDEEISEEDEMDEVNVSNPETEQALDFTAATLSKRRSFSLQFKLEVLNAFHSDRSCHGNQRATARKFGINRRQVQKWLGQELELRGEATYRGGLYRQRLGRWLDTEEGKRTEENDKPSDARVSCNQSQQPENVEDQCWDLSNKKRKAESVPEVPPLFKKRATDMVVLQHKEYVPYENNVVTSSVDKMYPFIQSEVQETALCLVKVEGRSKESTDERPMLNNPEVSSSVYKIKPDLIVRPVLFHPNREHSVTPPPIMLSSHPAHVGSFAPPPTFGSLHHMLNLYQGLVGECKIQRHTCPLDFKLDAVDCYHGHSDCHENQCVVASKFDVHHRQIQKWLQQETQLRQRSTNAHVLNMYR